MRVRRAGVQDAEAIGELHVRAWQVGYAGIVPAEHLDAMDPVERGARLRVLLADLPPEQAVLVAEDDGRVAGFVNFGPYRSPQGDEPDDGHEPYAWEIRAIYVAPDRWGTGAGRALMEAALRELSARGRRPVLLWVLGANQRARRFYERAGFAVDGATSVFRVERGGDPPVDLDKVRYVRDGGLA